MMKKYLSLFFILLSMACSKKNRITELKMPPVIHLTDTQQEIADSFGVSRILFPVGVCIEYVTCQR